jgi:FKBP-type peptidyl-prolyl cis-trans isomerase SlpA
VKRALLHELGDPDAEYPSATWCSSPRPTARAPTPAWCASSGEDWLLFDFNHPLAGQPVRFEVQVLGVL